MTERQLHRALFGSGSIFLFGRVVIVLMQVLALPVVTRTLPTSDYGTIAIAFIVSSLLSSVSDAGLPVAVARVYYDEDGHRTARGLVGLAVILGVIAAGVVDLLGPLWSRLLSEVEYGFVVRVAVWMSVASILRGVTLGILRAQNRAVAHTVVAVVSAVGGQGLGLLLMLGGERGARGYVLGVAIGSYVGALIGVALTGVVVPALGGRVLRRVFRFSLPTVPGTASRSVLSVGDRFVVEHFSGVAETGRYQVGYRIGSLGQLVIGELVRALVPVILPEDGHAARRITSSAQALMGRLAAAIALGLALLSPIVLQVFAPASYQPLELVAVTALVSAATVPYAYGRVASLSLLRAKTTQPMAWIVPLAAVLNLAMAALGVHFFGLEGAAWASLVALGLEGGMLVGVATRMGVHARPGPGEVRGAVLVMIACVVLAWVPVAGVPWIAARAAAASAVAIWILRSLLGARSEGGSHP